MKDKIHHTPTPQISKAYLLGALHDSTERKYTFRISQKSKLYVEMLAIGIKSLGFKAWVYKEGKDRNVYIVEFSKKVLNNFVIKNIKEKIDYVRGYFDSEGGIPRSLLSRYYIYFAQKNYVDLKKLRDYLFELGIQCGTIHNPSKRQDPEYFRFYILSASYNDFLSVIGSWHPEKFCRLRKKI
jgi:DNA-binding transcriptional regulator WhiA